MTLVAVTGVVGRKDMLRAGLIVGIPSTLVVALFFFILSSLGLI